jgi:uncharacterized membrane protein YbhN (UPF0104 family)
VNQEPAELAAPSASTLNAAMRKGVVSGLLLLLALILLVVGLSKTDIGAADIAALREAADLKLILLAIATMSLGFWFLALRWRALMPTDAHIPAMPLAGILVIAKLLNYAIPGPMGELAAAVFAARHTKLPAEATFAAGIHGRVIGLVASGVVAGIVFLAFPLPIEDWLSPWIRGAAVAALVCASGLGLASFRPKIIAWFADRLLGWTPRMAKVHASAHRFADALGSIGRIGIGRYLMAIVWALVAHSFNILGIWIACVAFGAKADIAGLVFTYAMATAGSVVLFTVPGSQAGWDAAFLLLLVSTAGLAKATAAAVTMVVQLQQIVLVLAGAAALARLRKMAQAT